MIAFNVFKISNFEHGVLWQCLTSTFGFCWGRESINAIQKRNNTFARSFIALYRYKSMTKNVQEIETYMNFYQRKPTQICMKNY